MRHDERVIARFGDCEVDLDRLEVRAAGETVGVEPQVFDVLSYLLEHRERMVTKEELLDNVWGDRFVTESALTSRIKSARRALGDNGRDQAVIRTVHRRGYQFVADVTMATDADVRRATAAHAPARIEPPRIDAPDLDGAWPLVGRHDEIEQLDRLIRGTSRSGVLLTGPAGIGKSRLARVCLERATAAGMTTAQVTGHPTAEEIPLAALAHLLPAEILDAGGTTGDLARTVIFQRARAAIEDLARGERLVMLVDNADQIDELSSALLGSLISSGSVFAVLTQRTAPGDALVLDELVRNGHMSHIDLGPLDDTDLDVLLYRVLAGPIDLQSLQQLTSLSRGRPGALQQLVETCLATNALDRDADVWRLVGPIQPAVGVPGHEQLLMSSLEPAAATGAELLAVAHELDLDLATEIIGAETLDVLDRAGLLSLADSPSGLRVSIAHAHLGILLEERLGPLRARRHKTRLVNAMDVGRATDHDRMRRVRWMLETGVVPDLPEAVRAARFAVATANAAADVILDHLDTTDDAERGRPTPRGAALQAGPDQRRRGAPAAGRRLTARPGHGSHCGAPARHDPIPRPRPVLRGPGTPRRGRAALRRPCARPRRGPLDRIAGVPRRGRTSLLERARGLPDDIERAPRLETLRGTAQAHVARGSFDESIATLDVHDRESRHLAAGAARAGNEMALATRIAAHTAAGEIRTASDLVRRHLPVGRRTMLAWLPMAAARSEMMAGRSRVARELISTPLAAVRSQSLIHAEPQMIGILAQSAARTGDIDVAVRQADECWAALDGLVGQLGWSLLISVADVRALTATRPEMIERLRAAADDARDAGASLMEAELLMAAARSGDAEHVIDRLDEVVTRVGGSLWVVRARHAACPRRTR